MTLKLVFKSNVSCEPEELLLSESSHGIGRMHDNDLSIQGECVSGYHAELKQTSDGGYAISDLNSTNGTFLNDDRVTSPKKVMPGDHLKLGDLLLIVEEHFEVDSQPETEPPPGGSPFKVISLKDEFEFTSEESFYTNPITPMRTPPASGNVNEALKHPGKIEDPDLESGIAAQQLERAREAQRVQQLERAREAERVQQIERAREAERVQQIERAREAERVQQLERAREAERVQQLERAREAERVQQIERAREAERVQQIERAREAERVQQLERAREAERVQQLERAREAERVQQIERAGEAERVQQIERAREAERVQQLERAREAERVQQIERAREAERVQQIERAGEAERVQQIERAREAERAEVDLREKPEPAARENSGSKVQNLTAQLESAMREIKRLKAFHVDESPRPPKMDSHAAAPANPGPPVAPRREYHAIQRSGNNDASIQS